MLFFGKHCIAVLITHAQPPLTAKGGRWTRGTFAHVFVVAGWRGGLGGTGTAPIQVAAAVAVAVAATAAIAKAERARQSAHSCNLPITRRLWQR